MQKEIKMIIHAIAYLCILFYSLLSGESYEVQDIGTLESKSSEAIDLNNKGEILGFYYTNDSTKDKIYFFREESGRMYAIPSEPDINIDWKFLKDDGRIYGTARKALYVWDKISKPKKVADLPNGDVVCISNGGEVLLQNLSEFCNGKKIYFSAIWKKGEKEEVITNLYGLGGNMGLAPKESYGLSFNDNGQVVGASHATDVFKNEMSTNHVRATLWKGQNSFDLHKLLPKATYSYGIAINDNGDIYIQSDAGNFLLKADQTLIELPYSFDKMNNKFAYTPQLFYNLDDKTTTSIYAVCQDEIKNPQSDWWTVDRIIKMNNRGEIIAQATTMNKENHAMLIKPKNRS